MPTKPHIVHLVAAARPNFMKVAPLFHELAGRAWCEPRIIHTGQHYDYNMSATFFKDLGLPQPAAHLEVGSGSHGQQIGRCLMAYEELLLDARPGWVVVVGDVNSTLACALAARRLGVPLAHLEAGLRSFDRDMPEEQNRLLTDQLADLLWTPSPDADKNLISEGVDPARIELVGNIMIDSFEMLRPVIQKQQAWLAFDLQAGGYGVVTLHRPNNVDQPETLQQVVTALEKASKRIPLIWPVHPRTVARLKQWGLLEDLEASPSLTLCEPLGYRQFMSLVEGSRLVITDSGGIQEETTYLYIPCLTLRPSTERPITVTMGSNRLVTPGELDACLDQILSGRWPQSHVPELWDGCTAARIADSLANRLSL